jgi:hypothetical protein
MMATIGFVMLKLRYNGSYGIEEQLENKVLASQKQLIMLLSRDI